MFRNCFLEFPYGKSHPLHQSSYSNGSLLTVVIGSLFVSFSECHLVLDTKLMLSTNIDGFVHLAQGNLDVA